MSHDHECSQQCDQVGNLRIEDEDAPPEIFETDIKTAQFQYDDKDIDIDSRLFHQGYCNTKRQRKDETLIRH